LVSIFLSVLKNACTITCGGYSEHTTGNRPRGNDNRVILHCPETNRSECHTKLPQIQSARFLEWAIEDGGANAHESKKVEWSCFLNVEIGGAHPF
jgi:hypothetical protein